MSGPATQVPEAWVTVTETSPWRSLSDLLTPRRVRRLGLGIAAAAFVVRLIGNLQGYYLIDDFVFIARATAWPLVSAEGLLDLHLGHFMPAGFALNWVVVHAAPFAYALPALLMALGWLASVVLMRTLLLDVMGPRPASLVPLAIYALAPITLQVTGWWAAALNGIPLQVAMLLALIALRHRLRAQQWTERLAWDASIVATFVVSLAFFEKSLLILPVLAGAAVAWSSHGRLHHAIVDVARRMAGVWIALAAISAAYLAVYLAMDEDLARAEEPPDISSVADIAGRALLRNAIPGVFGGPLDYSSSFADTFAEPPGWLIVLSLTLLAGLTVAALAAGPTAARLLALTSGYAIVVAVLIASGRSTFITEIGQAPRYFADLAIPFTLVVAATTVGWLDRSPAGTAARRAATMTISGIAGVVIIMSLLSTGSFFADLRDKPSADATAGALAALTARPGTTLLEQPVPGSILSPLAYPYDATSLVFGLWSPRPAIAGQAPSLDLWTDDGRLVPAAVIGPGVGRPGICGWTVDPEATVRLPAPVFPFVHTVELAIESPADAALEVRIGDGDTVTWQIPAGESRQYRQQVGGGDTVTFRSDTPVCVQAVTVGVAVADGADDTDQAAEEVTP